MNEFDVLCNGDSVINITYSREVVEALQQVNQFSYRFYNIVIAYFGPVNIGANLLGAGILLTKEMRNPFNLMLCFMCLDPVIPLIIRASLEYRVMSYGIECSMYTLTYSFAMHIMIEYNCWPPFRATYTWMTVILTFLRYRALRSKGKFEASYSLVIISSAIVALVTAAAGIPVYMANIIEYHPIVEECERQMMPLQGPDDAQVPVVMWSRELFVDNCLFYRLNQWITGIVHNTLPSFLLLTFTIMLAYELSQARKGHMAVAGQSARKSDDALRASRLMIIIAVLTLLSELPQGLACLANSLFSIGFQGNYTDHLTVLWTTIQICTTGFNLLIMLGMSKNFRNAVSGKFCILRKKNRSVNSVSVISISQRDQRKTQSRTI